MMTYTATDDDIKYTILGMLNLDHHGFDFARDLLRELWLKHQPAAFTWGPE
jgi:hypothetical protein